MESPTIDREQLRRLVLGELPAEDTAAVCALVSSDPHVARAYVEVKLELDQQPRCECAAPTNLALACAPRPPEESPAPAAPPADPAPTAPHMAAAPLNLGQAALFFLVAAALGFALMGLMTFVWSRT